MNKQGEYLYISGSGKHEFSSEIFEVFGVDLWLYKPNKIFMIFIDFPP